MKRIFIKTTIACFIAGLTLSGCEKDETANKSVSVSGVSLNETSITLTAGDTLVLTATVAPYNASNKTLAWTSSDPEIVSVIAGTVAALAVGQAVITVGAADGGKTASCTVTVVPEITMATTADEVRIGFEISSSEAATVDWGDGNRQNITSVGFTFYSHDYAASSDSRTITITGGKVTQLDCGGNRLTALDVSANTALIHFYCRDNRLTALDASANTALTHLDCEDNLLTAEALNALFETLHDNKGHSKSVFVSNNPGEAECDKGIAERKEWSVATRLN